MKYQEFNFDGIVGPTHHYGGLSTGNNASIKNSSNKSHPKSAALQGLKKMKYLADKGIPQAVLPPHPRPTNKILTKHKVKNLQKLLNSNPKLLSQLCSAASMWTANCATISPSPDTADKKCHLTPANLHNKLHRRIESEQSHKILKQIFSSSDHFTVHNPLTTNPEENGDEGAANHTRLCNEHGNQGIEIFTFGIDHQSPEIKPKIHPARQSLAASRAIASCHQLQPEHTIFVQQNPQVIDAGVFHNDVICVGNQQVLLLHEQAFVNQQKFYSDIKNLCPWIKIIEVKESEVSVEESVKSYLFNSQLITKSHGEYILICPEDVEKSAQAHNNVNKIISNPINPISEVKYFDLRQSMSNGGGPACLRLRVVLSESEKAALNGNIILTEKLYAELKKWINEFYQADLKLEDLAKNDFHTKNIEAFKCLESILNLKIL